jgi:glutaredoxin
MRSFMIAAGMTGLVAGLGFALAPAPPAASGAQGASSLPDALSDASAAPAQAGAERDAAQRAGATATAPSAGKRTFYQWTDERGSVRFARSLDDVPAEWRARAGQVEVDAAAYQPKRGVSGARAGARRAYSQQPAPAERRADFHDVTVYTAPWCGWCRKTLAFLDERDVDYVNKNIEADEDYADELREKSGGHAIPFVEIDGAQIRGYNPRKMAALLE